MGDSTILIEDSLLVSMVRTLRLRAGVTREETVTASAPPSPTLRLPAVTKGSASTGDRSIFAV